MVRLRYLSYLMLCHWILAAPQINLYYTDWEEESEIDNHPLEHNCFHVIEVNKNQDKTLSVSSFCLGEFPSNLAITSTELFPKLTFAQLVKQNITSEQLYLRSAPIDVVERYQFYLDHLSSSYNHPLENDVFYQCTLPRFGPQCQYELEFYDSGYSSLYDLVRALDKAYPYQPTSLTCYEHLQCNRGPSPLCLDWTDICNGQIDCPDGKFDEEHCWQLEMNECNEDEHQCRNGQCIPKAFVGEPGEDYYDCIDGSDEIIPSLIMHPCEGNTMPYRCEDMLCDKRAVLTSSCDQNRQYLLQQAMFTHKDESISDQCWSAFKCGMNIYQNTSETCSGVCSGHKCIEMIERECVDTMTVPSVPVLFSHVYFVYYKNTSQTFNQTKRPDFYICHNTSYYDDYIYWKPTMMTVINQMKCYRQNSILMFSRPVSLSQGLFLPDLHQELWKYNQVFNYTPSFCNRPNMYQCSGSNKCIANYRRNNSKKDCPGSEDEMEVILVDDPFSADQLLTFSHYWKEREKQIIRYLRLNISFLAVCNGYVEMLPILINGKNHTDETDCQVWECDNIYTRCNNFWNCLDGADELNCELPFKLDCSADEHKCVSPRTNALMCLPIAKANDGHIDCLGGTDEPVLCRKSYEFEYPDNFYCMNSSAKPCVDAMVLCDGNNDCKYGDDEQFCDEDWIRPETTDFCYDPDVPLPSRPDSAKFLCRTLAARSTFPFVYFSLTPPRKLFIDHIRSIETKALASLSLKARFDQYQPRCHRGLDVRVWSNDQEHSTTRTCFCPPTFYGDTCQYQKQRISLGLKFRAFSDSRQTPFAVVVSLIDDSIHRIIHSFEQFTYLASRDCPKKFNVYLFYSTRPKNETITYQIHIDIYEKLSFTYRGSFLLPIPFPFLPVHRLAFIIDIPRTNEPVYNCFDLPCVHGKCLQYFNNRENASFCQCNEGWSGKYCSIRHNCTCSTGSLCLGISANNRRSICLCRSDRFGPRCLMKTACQTSDQSLCKNRGQCIPSDEYVDLPKPYTCKCSKDFSGDYCEKNGTKIILTFDKDIVVSQSIFLHFIEVRHEDDPLRATTFLTSVIEQESITTYWSQPFHIAFIEFPTNRYYFILVQTTPRQRLVYREKIESSDRCPHIREIFNATLMNWHPLRQIKHFHLACQIHSFNLSCFYDDNRLCLCYTHEGRRLANCLDFQHNMTLDCFGQSECQNGAPCIQDVLDCPRRSMCICPPCYYGRLCQFSTSSFGLSLDVILAYTILPDASLIHQKSIIKISMALTIIFMIIGLINSILSLITFQNKAALEVGCGLYLLGLSISTFFTTILFGFKFWFLILTQTGVIVNQSFLEIQCHSMEFLLRLGLNMDQWLSACVAIERAVMTIQGAGFNKRKSKQAAKLVITIVFLMNIMSTIYDPIHRRLIEEKDDDDNERRVWCIVSYSQNLQVFNSATYLFHFFGPFLINFISAMILVTKKSYQQSNLRSTGRLRELFRKQFQEHKHLFTGPILLVILALPRLIIFFVSQCMESASDAWLYLLGYFISFIPPMTTFLIFVLPSTVYKNEFRKVMVQYRSRPQSVEIDHSKPSSSQPTAPCSRIRRRKLMWIVLSSIALVLIILSIGIPIVIVKRTTTEPKDTLVSITGDSKWMQDGITIVGANGDEELESDSYSPFGICMDDDTQSFYIAETTYHSVVKWKYHSVEADGQIVAGGNGRGNRTNQLNSPTDVVVDKTTNSLVICDQFNRRLVRWSLENGKNGQILTHSITCVDLTVDNNGDLYVVDSRNNAIVRWKQGHTDRTIVAGGNGNGSALNQLNGPSFIFVDQHYSIYVSERKNHRVTKWMQGAKQGIIVAGGQGRGNNLTQLDYPEGVFVDHLESVYIVDSNNHRIMRWLQGSTEGTVVVGGNGKGSQSNQFAEPRDISFDRENNLYVVDRENSRIQKFKMIPS